MRPRRFQGFMLVEVLLWATLMGVVLSIAMAATNDIVVIQRRIAAWEDDDTVTQDLLRGLRRDVAAAVKVDAPSQQRLVLHLVHPERNITYRASAEGVGRTLQEAKGGAVRRTWRLRRSALKWLIDRTPTGGSVLWTNVEIRDPLRKTSQIVHSYAVAMRLGAAVGWETMP
jgi:hypothetical protein